MRVGFSDTLVGSSFRSPLALDFISNITFLSLIRVIRIHLLQNIINGHARNILDPLTKTGEFPIGNFFFKMLMYGIIFNDLKSSKLITRIILRSQALV